MTPGTIYLPNGAVIRQRAAPMPVIPRSRLIQTAAVRERLARMREIYDRPIGPQNRVTLPYAVEALLKLSGPLPCIVVERPTDEPKAPIVPEVHITAQQIVRVVRQAYNIDLTDLLSLRRHRSTVRARQVCYWLIKRHTSLSLPQIGRHLGGRDHTTVLHGVRVIDQLLSADTKEAADIRFVVDLCKRQLGLADDPG